MVTIPTNLFTVGALDALEGVKKVLGPGSSAQQFLLWQVGAQIAQAIMGPSMQALGAMLWRTDPNLPVPPATLAQLVARGHLTRDRGLDLATSSGVGGLTFDSMVDEVRRAPDLSIVMELSRRGLIPADGAPDGPPSLRGAIADTGVRSDWVDLVGELRTQIPTVAEVMGAWLQGQIEEPEARRRYDLAGGDPSWFQTSYNAQGAAPTPNEAATMANRRIIGWDGTGPAAVTFQQAFLEGPWRNKWEPAWRKLAEYLPPPRTVTALLRAGSITEAQALDIFQKSGLTPELAAAYVHNASSTTVHAARQISAAQAIKLYEDRIVSRGDALSMLEALSYNAHDAAELLAMADFGTAVKLMNASVSRVHALFVGHKITQAAAEQALKDLKVPVDQTGDILTHWKLEKSLNVRRLTEAQIVGSWGDGILSDQEAIDELVGLGYSDFDAWVLMSHADHKPRPGRPGRTTGDPGVNP